MTATAAPRRSADVIQTVVGAHLRAKGLTRHSWAKQTGLDYKYLDNLWHGRTAASESILRKLAAALDLGPHDTHLFLLQCGVMPSNITELAAKRPNAFLSSLKEDGLLD